MNELLFFSDDEALMKQLEQKLFSELSVSEEQVEEKEEKEQSDHVIKNIDFSSEKREREDVIAISLSVVIKSFNSLSIKSSQKMIAIEISSRKIDYSSRQTRSEKAYYFSLCAKIFLARSLRISIFLVTTLYESQSYKNALKCSDAEK